MAKNKGSSGTAQKTKHKNSRRQNITFACVVFLCVAFVFGWWIVAITNGYYAAFIDYDESNSELALESADNRTFSEESEEILEPLQSEFDSWRTQHLAEHVYVTGAEGNILHGVFYECGYDKTVIVLPGYGQTAESDFLYAVFYESIGYNILLTDPRCLGESEGEYLSYGLQERYDAAAWCDFAVSMGYGEEIIIHGTGMGAAAALMAGGDSLLPDSVSLIIAEGVYDSLSELADYQMGAWFGLPSFPILNLIELKMKGNIPYELEDVVVSDWVSELTVDTIFIAGEQDEYMPFEFSQSVFEACSGNAEWILVEDAQWCMCYPLASDEIQAAIKSAISDY